jgi:mRNA-degrading endonuclease YafQ of YafQ-DinJ toxin-antitoxin module
MYKLEFLEDFWKVYNKLVKGNPVLQKKFFNCLDKMATDPFYSSLKTHKVDSKKYKNVYSSWVSADVRIIWAFDEKQELIILVLETGTHSGGNMVYGKKSS